MDTGAAGSQNSFFLNDQSIVSINGVQARLEVDRETGNIKVIPLEKPTINDEAQRDTVKDDLGKAIHNEETEAVLAQNFQVLQDTLLCSEPQQPPNCHIQNTQEIPETSTRELCSITGDAEEETKLIDEHISNSKTNSLFDGPPNSISVARLEDLPNQTEAIEPDLLEQLLSSVARDFQFINSASTLNENTSSILEPNLMLPSTKVDISFANTNDAADKNLAVSTESIFSDSEALTSTLNAHSEIAFSEKDGQYGSWDLTSDALETCPSTRKQYFVPNTQNLEINHSSPDSQDKAFVACSSTHGSDICDNSILSKSSKQKRVSNYVTKYKSIRPKPVAQNMILLTIPIGAYENACPPGLPLPLNSTLSVIDKMNTRHGAGVMKIKEQENGINITKNESSQPNDEQAKMDLLPRSISPDEQVVTNCRSKTVELPTATPQQGLTMSSFSCPVCHNSFLCRSKVDFQSHLLSHPNLCTLCEISFEKEMEFFNHLKEHDVELVTDEGGGVELKCLICEELFLHASNMQRHVMGHILDGLKAHNQFNSQQHVSLGNNGNQVPEVKKVICHQCGKLLKAKSLTVHIKTHCPANNPDKTTSPVQCKDCRGLFLNMMTYKRHLQHSCRVPNQPTCKDSAVPMVTCNQCFKSVSSSSLSTHKSQYCPAANPAKQICKYCGVVLKHKHSLRNHVKWHCKKSPSATSPMRCLCNKVFRNYKAFQSHYQNHCMGREGEGNDA